jgi:hypothetical protein
VSIDDDGLGEKKIKLINMGKFQGLNMSCSGQTLSLGRHKVFNWTDAESTFKIYKNSPTKQTTMMADRMMQSLIPWSSNGMM